TISLDDIHHPDAPPPAPIAQEALEPSHVPNMDIQVELAYKHRNQQESAASVPSTPLLPTEEAAPSEIADPMEVHTERDTLPWTEIEEDHAPVPVTPLAMEEIAPIRATEEMTLEPWDANGQPITRPVWVRVTQFNDEAHASAYWQYIRTRDPR